VNPAGKKKIGKSERVTANRDSLESRIFLSSVPEPVPSLHRKNKDLMIGQIRVGGSPSFR
jgi:hypothetical protein